MSVPKAVMTDWLAPSVVPWSRRGLDWLVTLHWGEVNGIAVCVGLEVHPPTDRPAQLLTPEILRSVPLGTLVRSARRARYEATRGPDIEALSDVGEGVLGLGVGDGEADAWKELRQHRRPRVTEEEYAETARIYASALELRTPVHRAVMDRLHVSSAGASRRIAGARKRGLLPPTSPGKASAKLTRQEKK